MASDPQADLVEAFEAELSYLREQGAQFAQDYPKIAARLGLAGHHVSDPHVERLIEAFAFLTARIQKSIALDLPELTTQLLGALHPHLVAPVPSMAIAELDASDKPTVLTRGTVLYADAAGGETCRFRTAYPVSLAPIEITDAGIVAPESLDVRPDVRDVAAVLHIRVEAKEGNLEDFGLDRLRFFLGTGGSAARLYDTLFAHGLGVRVDLDPGAAAPDPARAHDVRQSVPRIEPVGFAADEALLPSADSTHPALRLLQESLAFPEKFLFFDVVPGAPLRGRTAHIHVWLSRRPPESVIVQKSTLRLRCTPIVNLFSMSAEPIRVDHRQPDYRLVADHRRERYTAVHSIERVAATAPGEEKQRVFVPFFAYSHHLPEGAPEAFWFARRVPCDRKELSGTDVYVSFVDTRFTLQRPPVDSVYATVLCTNRDLSAEMDAGARLTIEEAPDVAAVRCLTKPTPERSPPLGGETLWRLVSNLSTNHLSLVEGKEGLSALRGVLLAQLVWDSPEALRQITGIAAVSSRPVTRAVGRGFCRGREITLTVNEREFVGSSPVLFGAVLSSFFSLYAHYSSFTELVLKSTGREEVWRRWPPMAGGKALL